MLYLVIYFLVNEQESPFSVAENELFEKRYTEGYDLTTDHRYNQWLQACHPDSTIVAHLPQVSQGTLVPFTAGMTTFARSQQSVGRFSRFLQPPTPPSKNFTRSAKSSSRVLTSAESRRFLQEKEEKKREKEAQKEKRKKDAEERRRICNEIKEQKRLEKVQQAAAKKNDPNRGKCIWIYLHMFICIYMTIYIYNIFGIAIWLHYLILLAVHACMLAISIYTIRNTI